MYDLEFIKKLANQWSTLKIFGYKSEFFCSVIESCWNITGYEYNNV